MFCIFNTMGAADLITQLLFEIRLRVIEFYIKCNNMCERRNNVNCEYICNKCSTFITIDDVSKNTRIYRELFLTA